MTEEQKCETQKCDCICMSKGFRKFLIVTFGSFFGVFFALCLFHAINKPPVPGMYPPPPYHHECRCDHHGHHGDFHKKFPPKPDRKAPHKLDKKAK